MLIKKKKPEEEGQKTPQQVPLPNHTPKEHSKTTAAPRHVPKQMPKDILTVADIVLPELTRKPPRTLFLVFVILTAFITIAGFFYYKVQKEDLKKGIAEQLLTVADLKANQIVNWRQERLADAATIRENSFLGPYVQELTADPRGARKKKELVTWMKSFREAFQYEELLLMSSSGSIILSATGETTPVADPSMKAVSEAAKTGKITIADLYKDEGADKPRIDIAVPLINEARDSVLCVFLLRIDPYLFLFPLIEAWPTPSYSAETMLVRPEGNSILYLNNVRHQKGTALTLRLPINQPDLPAGAAVRDKEGVIEGSDYRGIPVIAALKAIPNTPWHIIAKIDKEEVYTPIRNKLWTIMTIISLCIFSASAAVFLIWQRFEEQRQKAYNTTLKATVKERTAELERINKQLREFNKDLESFSYSVSHDLRQPLITIEGFSNRLMKKQWENLDDKGREDLAVIKEEASKMGALINDVLAFCMASTKEIRRENVNLDTMAHTVAEDMKASTPDRKIQFDIGELPSAYGDTSMIKQVMVNLISNAIKYTRPRDVAKIQIGTVDHEKAYVYYVKDNGVGFNGDDQANLFTIFKRLHSTEEYEGTGIGLVIAKRIINKHGGQVWAEGKVNEGATFYFSLPKSSQT